VLAIQQEYDKKRQPFYQQRAQVLTGESSRMGDGSAVGGRRCIQQQQQQHQVFTGESSRMGDGSAG
jgi:hypothetical protein